MKTFNKIISIFITMIIMFNVFSFNASADDIYCVATYQGDTYLTFTDFNDKNSYVDTIYFLNVMNDGSLYIDFYGSGDAYYWWCEKQYSKTKYIKFDTDCIYYAHQNTEVYYQIRKNEKFISYDGDYDLYIMDDSSFYINDETKNNYFRAFTKFNDNDTWKKYFNYINGLVFNDKPYLKIKLCPNFNYYDSEKTYIFEIMGTSYKITPDIMNNKPVDISNQNSENIDYLIMSQLRSKNEQLKKDIESLTNKVADVDNDGTITIADALTTLQYYTRNTLLGENITWEDILNKSE